MAPLVNAVVKSVLIFGEHAPDDHAIEGLVPANPKHFGFSAQVFIGEADNDLVDSFDL